MRLRTRATVLLIVMAGVAAAGTGISVYELYHTALQEAGARLREATQSEARLIESVARFDADYSTDYPGGPAAATLAQIRAAHAEFSPQARSGEYLLGHAKGGRIHFVLRHGNGPSSEPEPIPLQSDVGEPMRRALAGQAGTLFGRDYRGKQVLAAYEPLRGLGLGLVAKIDLAEIRAPYIRAGLLAAGGTAAMVVFGAILFIRIGAPVVRRVEESERRVRELFEQSGELIAVLDANGNVEDVNPAYARTLGITRAEVLGQCFGEAARMVDAGPVQAVLDKLSTGAPVPHFQTRCRLASGEIATITWTATRTAARTRVFLIGRDETTRQRGEDALRASERFVRGTLDGLSAHIAIVDADGVIVAVNEAWRTFAEQNPPVNGNVTEGASYLGVCAAATDDDAETAQSVVAGMRAVLYGVQPFFELEYACHSPEEERWFIGRVTRFPDDGPPRVIVAHENITARKQAERRLAEQRELLDQIISYIPHSVFWKDRASNYLGCNDQFGRVAGVQNRHEIVGKSDYDLPWTRAESDWYRECDRRVMAQNQALLDIEESQRRSDGSETTVLTSKVPLHDNDGNVNGILGIYADISDQKRVQRDLEEALQEARSRRTEVEGLLRGARSVLEHDTFQRAAQGIFNACKDLTGATAGYVALQSHAGNSNEVVYLDAGTLECTVDPNLPMPIRGLRAIAYRTGRAVYDNNFAESDWTKLLPGGHVALDNVLFAPLLLDNVVVGLVGLANKPGGFLERDVHMATAFAELAAIALRNTRTLDQLRASESRWAELVHNNPDGIVVLNTAGELIAVNPAAAAITGLRPDELVGRHFGALGLFAGDSLARVESEFAKVVRGAARAPYVVTFTRADGAQRCMEIGGQLVSSMSERRLQATIRDVTAREQADERIRLLSTALQTTAEAVVITDRTGHIRWVNDAYHNLTGFRADDVVDQLWGVAERAQQNEPPYAGLWQLVQSGQTWSGTLQCQRKDGSEYTVSMTITPVVRDGKEITHFTTIQQDITEQRILESQRMQAQKLESIGQLAAGIAHEINTPTQYVSDNTRFLRDSVTDLLKLIDTCAETLALDAPAVDWRARRSHFTSALEELEIDFLREEIPKAIEQSLEGLERVTRIVRAMKDFSHPAAEGFTEADLNKAIESTVTVARNEWKYVAELELDLAPDLPLVPVLLGEFNQVILNLVINAAHAIADVVGDGAAQRGTIQVTTRRVEECAEIRVSDTGTGIPDQHRARVFDHFFTTKQVGQGTGQGLALAHSVIRERHGGTIDFDTEVGRGTTFIIRLPLEGPQRPASGMEPKSETVS